MTIGGRSAISPYTGEIPGSLGSCSPTYRGAHSAAIDGEISGSRLTGRIPSMSIARSAQGQINPSAAGRRDPAIPQRHRQRQRQPAARRITSDHNPFRVQPIHEHPAEYTATISSRAIGY